MTYVGIYWNNHHHLLQAVRHVNGLTLWANLHLLFWLFLFPFAAAWMGENNFAAVPVALYGLVVLLAAIAYFILTRVLIAHHGKDSTLAAAIGRDAKGKISVGIYVIAVVSALIVPWFACLLYVLVAILWLIPDRRIERSLMT
ncbi:MAG: TMEM175 family protein [Leptodesmis sp.]|uniref:TMEM175 family protein n=1 Tax=Leptodesmis sp. TaxID=3100501 RepID=UPI003D0DE160